MNQELHHPRYVPFCLMSVAFLLGFLGCDSPAEVTGNIQWWKGNTHTHTLWSDGNAAPEKVSAWYRNHGYHFLVLSDHNVLSVGDRWFPVSTQGDGRLREQHVAELRRDFGEEWVETRKNNNYLEMRLKTLTELREFFEVPGEFLFIQGEEVTDRFEKQEVHINAINVDELIMPQHGNSLIETIQRNLDAIIESGKRNDRPVMAHVNHPNFGWSLTARDIATIRGERFFEVYNGHPSVHNEGDKTRPSTERMWDIANTLRLTELDLPLLFGMATDDAHHYFTEGEGKANTGRGWVMVRAAALTPEHLLEAMHAGEFYGTSGVKLEYIRVNLSDFTISIAKEKGVTYRTEFIGALKKKDGSMEIGKVFQVNSDNPATYSFSGNELFVRAKVVSNRLHPNPYKKGDFETAWLQPVVPGSGEYQ